MKLLKYRAGASGTNFECSSMTCGGSNTELYVTDSCLSSVVETMYAPDERTRSGFTETVVFGSGLAAADC